MSYMDLDKYKSSAPIGSKCLQRLYWRIFLKS